MCGVCHVGLGAVAHGCLMFGLEMTKCRVIPSASPAHREESGTHGIRLPRDVSHPCLPVSHFPFFLAGCAWCTPVKPSSQLFGSRVSHLDLGLPFPQMFSAYTTEWFSSAYSISRSREVRPALKRALCVDHG